MSHQNVRQVPSTEGNRATVKDIVASLTAVGLPAPARPTLEAISANCRDAFLNALRACVMKKDADGTKRAYLENVLACLDPSVTNALKELRLVASPTDLIRIAEFKPARFRSAVAIAQNSSHERHAEATDFLRTFLAAKAWQVEAQTPAANPHAMYDIPGMPPDPHDCGNQAQPSPALRQQATREPERRENASEQRSAHAVGNERRPAPSAPSADITRLASNPDSGRAVDFRSHHVYGSDYALCFNASTSQDGKPTIMVDAAVANGQRSYDWKNAIHIMLDVREVACVLAVFRKWRPAVEFSAHGKRNDKAFSLEWQGKHFFCKVAARMDHKPVRAVKIMSHDAIQVAMLFLEQLLLAYPNVPPAEVLELARSVNSVDERRVVNQ